MTNHGEVWRALAAEAASGECYYPQIIEYNDGGRLEFLLRDCLAVYRKGDHYDTIIDYENGEVIGFAWDAGTNPAIAPKPDRPRPSVAKQLAEVLGKIRAALAAYRKEIDNGA